MIGPVQIKNFKSVRDLSFEARRVNVFIGEPNTGKSNVIEALAIFAEGVLRNFAEVFRFKNAADLFFDQKVAETITIRAGEWEFTLKFTGTDFQGHFFQSPNEQTKIPKGQVQLHHAGLITWSEIKTPLRYYRFKALDAFPNGQPGALVPPFGDNLVAVLYSNEELRQKIGSLIRSMHFRLQLKPTDNELFIAKDVNDELYSYPWRSVSETLRRVVFLMVVLETNQAATLLLDEPEANTFPFYTKYLAERIALDKTNQFFMTTHNPYLLSSVVEKTPMKDLAVFVTRMDKFETKVKQIPDKNLPELLELDSDAFFNLDRLVEG